MTKYTFFVKTVSKEKWNAVKEIVDMVLGLKEEEERTTRRTHEWHSKVLLYNIVMVDKSGSVCAEIGIL